MILVLDSCIVSKLNYSVEPCECQCGARDAQTIQLSIRQQSVVTRQIGNKATVAMKLLRLFHPRNWGDESMTSILRSKGDVLGMLVMFSGLKKEKI